MFSNLGKGSVLQGVVKSGDKLKWFTGTVERITPSLSNPYLYSNTFGQFPSVSLDIVANIDGKQREFKGVHSEDTIADFGKNTAILADSETSLFNHINSLLKTSEEAVNEDNIAWHKKMIPQYRDILSYMRPGAANNSEVKELKEQVGSLQAQLAEALALLKGENKPKA
jgi:hypothetical protein